MIISEKHAFAFIHIPKCAGTSIRSMITAADPDRFQQWGWNWMPRHQRYGDTAHMPLIDLAPHLLAQVRDYRAITVVRDPLDRFFSSVEQHFSQHDYRARKSVEEFVFELNTTNIRYDPAYVHFCPQHYFIAIGPKTHVDDILRFEDETWPEAFREILIEQKMPEDKLVLPQLNKRKEARQEPLSDEALSHLYRLYKRDYALLGYTPPVTGTFDLNTAECKNMAKPFDFSAYDSIRIMQASFKKDI
ncbi:MAG: sulfotransferase family 2 domain-containing protein [Pseudomonadota bacterium]